MARIFSWHIKDESKDCFSYLATSGTSGNYSAGYMVLGDKISDTDALTSIANVVSAYTETVYKTQFDRMKQAVADCGFTVTWKDYKEYYDVDGSNLVMLTGIGEKGEAGSQGIQGPKGETGAAGKGRNIMCYCGLDSGITPTRANVKGGKFYPNQWKIEYPTDPTGVCTWQDSNEFGSGKVVWMTNADFPSSTGDSPSEAVTPVTKTDSHGQTYTWATPIQISGPKGDNGADGDNIEFVYKRAHKRTDPVPSRPTGTTEAEAEAQGWTDHPLGIVGDSDNPDENWRVEYMCQHIKDPDTKQWGEFSEPILWASWGEDGNDGDGIEYIFAITQDYSAPGNVPKSTDARLADHWQDPEIWDYIKEHGLESYYTPWTDDPSDVSSGEPYEWVCIRRSKWDAANEHSVYSEFGDPVLWAHWGKDGEKGNDGTSVDIRDQADTLGKLLKKLGNNVPQVGFSYAIGTDGKRVYVWMEQDSTYHVGRSEYTPPMTPATWYDKPDSEIYNRYYYKKDNKNYWFTDCGSFYGEPGENAYLHIKYATDYTGQTGVDHIVTEIKGVDGTRDICFTTGGTTLGETPGPYIATYSDNIHDDRGDLPFYNGKWAKFEGEDGQSYGQEQIFFRSASLIDTRSYSKKATTTEHGYDAGEWYLNVDYTGSFDKVDWVPTNWTDVPMGIINGIYNFEYVSVRRLLEDGTWSYFSEPALYNEASDTTDFQVEYSTWTGETTPVLANASEYTDENGNFDEPGWRAAHASTGPWSDSNTNTTVWMATAQKIKKNSNSATTIWNDWQITRCKGINGKAGNGRNVMCYCSLPEGYKPTRANLAGGKFYPNKWDITYPTDPVGIIVEGVKKYCSWGDSNEPVDPTYKVWMSNADFPSSTGTSEGEAVDPIVKTDTQHQEYTWSTPVCITGENGDNGADGDGIEFIYFRTKGEKPDTPTEISQEPDFRPEVYINGVDQGVKWNDHPEGIDEEWRYEWMSQRTKDEHGIWGSFSSVAQWSRWGEDGIDGDGVEYIFATAATLDAGPTLFAKVPKQESFTEEVWQTPEIWDYIKEHHMESTYAPWTDDPADVSPDEPYEFVSIRRRKYDDDEGNAIFGPFEEPALWARWADDGDSIFTSFAFTSRIVGDDISDYTVSGFDTSDFTPTTTKNESGVDVSSQFTWTDTAPKTSNIIWMVSGVFKKHHNAKTGVDTYEQQGNWGPITRMVDTENFEVMYSPGKPISGGYDENDIELLPTGFTKTGKEITQSWLTLANAVGWYDEVDEIPAGYGAVWMAQITGSNNVFNDNDWQYMKVKGEKGIPGDARHDLDYLKDIFGEKNVDQGPGAILREFLGVTEGADTGSTIVAFMNGSNGNNNSFIDPTHGKLMIAAGANGLGNVHSAKFRVYADGSVFAENGYFRGEIVSNTGNIGGISISSDGISTTGEGNGFSFGSDGTVSITNKNFSIDNNSISFFGNNGEIVLSVYNGVYSSLDSFIGTMTGDTAGTTVMSIVPFSEYSPTYSPGGSFDSQTFYSYIDEPIEITGTTFTIPSGKKMNTQIKIHWLNIAIIPNGCDGRIYNPYFDCWYGIALCLVDSNGVAVYTKKFVQIPGSGGEDINNTGVVSYTDLILNVSVLNEGTYHLELRNVSEAAPSLGGTVNINIADYSSYQQNLWSIHNVIEFARIEIEAKPVNSGTEIFRNGIAVKNSPDDYFFLATPDNGQPSSLILSVKSNGKGFTLDQNGWTNHGITP